LVTQLRRQLDFPEREQQEERLRSLLLQGVRPCVPELVNSLGMRFALIPPGIFVMGRSDEEASYPEEVPRHVVEITRPFYLGIYPVTQKQYMTLMGDNPSRFTTQDETIRADGITSTDDFPVEGISWQMAAEFCQKLSARTNESKAAREYRLPTEAEWEYACRAGTTTVFHLGFPITSDLANFDGTEPLGGWAVGPFLGRTTPVGSYPPNGFGLFDMHGNVNEWCSDWYDELYYQESPVQDPEGPETGNSKVFRGGNWWVHAVGCRSGFRAGQNPTNQTPNEGLRVALTLER
jgi:formylglycine-generating enzyme required for sulfatase activity